MSGATALKRTFKEFESKDLVSGAAVRDEPLQDRSALILDLTASDRKERAYRARKPFVANVSNAAVVFPSLLTQTNNLELSRDELENETRLLLERKQEIPFQDDTYVYAIRAIVPAPFRPSASLEQLLTSLAAPLANDIRAGYLTHDILYGLLPDEGRLVALLHAFFRDVTEVEVKVRRAPQGQRTVVVTLVG
jgi:hypothetical protein